MMKNGTEIVFILDKSGSMAGMEKDTIGGFNAMLEKQKREEGNALISTILFNGSCTVIHDRVNVNQIHPLSEKEYQVSGCTALLDAIGGAIHHISTVHRYARKEDVPEHTLFVITTDGMENASKRYTKEAIQNMISRQKEKGWQFLFLAANIDAAETASWYGIDEDHAVNYRCDEAGTELNYEVVSDAIVNVRRGRKLSSGWKSRIEKDYQTRK
jgi:uncharacterized protein YegL